MKLELEKKEIDLIIKHLANGKWIEVNDTLASIKNQLQKWQEEKSVKKPS